MAQSWLVKQEPSAYPFASLVKDGGTRWDGVRNPSARNNLSAMRKGDVVLYYHTGDEKAVVGIARVTRDGYPDPTAPGTPWVAVDLAPVKAMVRPVTLAEVKADPAFAGFVLVRQARLSVMPVGEAELKRILALGETKL